MTSNKFSSGSEYLPGTHPILYMPPLVKHLRKIRNKTVHLGLILMSQVDTVNSEPIKYNWVSNYLSCLSLLQLIKYISIVTIVKILKSQIQE